MRYLAPWPLIFSTFLIAFFLMILPMPAWAIWFRPAWVLIALIYWSMMLPYQVNVGAAWVVGMLVDVLNGSLLGEHALAFTVSVYIVVSRYSQFRMYPVLQQALWIFFVVFIYQFILFCILSVISVPPKTWLYWTPALTSMLIWPWVLGMMRNYQRKFKAA